MRASRSWLVALVVAAFVAVLVRGVLVVAEQVGSTRPQPSADDGAGVRWHPDLPPGVRPAEVPDAVPPINHEVSFPAAEVAGAFTPALSQSMSKPYCGADDLTSGIDRGDGPGQVRFRLEAARDDVACVVSSYPFQQYTRDGEPVEVLSRVPDPRPGDWPSSVLVSPGHAAELRTTWAGWCEAPPFDTVEQIFDDNSITRIEIAGQVTHCAGTPPDELPQRMLMTGWEPGSWRLDPPSDFSGLRARLVRTVDGPKGLPTWVVELTARRDISLDTCPSWEVRQGGERAVSWRLNCAEVPHQRADGTPYLPAGEPVRFAVWVPYGDVDASLTWVLTTPDGDVTLPLSEGPPAPAGEPRLVEEAEANLHLWLSNQSFDDPEVRLTVEVDGVEVVDEEFAVEGQHNFVAFHLALSPGRHEVAVTGDTGVRVVRTVRMPERGDRWAAALSWGSADTPRLEWLWQDHPIAWA